MSFILYFMFTMDLLVLILQLNPVWHESKVHVNCTLSFIHKTSPLLYLASITRASWWKCKQCLTLVLWKLKVSLISYLHHIMGDNAPLYIFCLETQTQKTLPLFEDFTNALSGSFLKQKYLNYFLALNYLHKGSFVLFDVYGVYKGMYLFGVSWQSDLPH